jgi:hypothetical protein
LAQRRSFQRARNPRFLYREIATEKLTKNARHIAEDPNTYGTIESIIYCHVIRPFEATYKGTIHTLDFKNIRPFQVFGLRPAPEHGFGKNQLELSKYVATL